MNIIITGASKGIGLELCKKFLDKKENKIIALSRSNSNLSAHTINNLTYLRMDLNKSNFEESLLPVVKERFGKIDIIINNAGSLINKPFNSLSNDDFDTMFNTNVKSVFRLIRDLMPVINSGAHIVNITSMGGFQGTSKFPGLSLYSASKGALSILTECLAEELKETNIYVNALALGAVQTEMLSEAFPGYNAPLLPGEMADYIYDFAINGKRYFNGKILPVSISTP
jgi:NAD(P)-dependent dehydrogenase (short-subunit alcohol dehydrogenase family)